MNGTQQSKNSTSQVYLATTRQELSKKELSLLPPSASPEVNGESLRPLSRIFRIELSSNSIRIRPISSYRRIDTFYLY